MKHVLRTLSLWLLLVVAQQGAFVHEVGHFAGAPVSGASVESGGSGDAACVACTAFAQVVTPAFSHAFQTPALVRAAPERIAAPPFSAITAAAPQPRSRGPPTSS